MRVEVVYARAQAQECVTLKMEEGTAVGQAVRASGLVEIHPEIVQGLRLAIFGKAVSPETLLRDGDRVEILRPLAMDPKEARRRRARRTRV